MKNIGILTCSNTTQDLGCSASKCLGAVYRNEDEFKRHEDQGGTQLAGIINCAGCPTIAGPEKILGRVRSLSALGVEAITITKEMFTRWEDDSVAVAAIDAASEKLKKI